MNNLTKALIAVATAGSFLAAPSAFAEGSETISAKGATVEITNESGYPTAAINGGTTLTLKGSNFQAIKGGAGGVYVLFGWVSNDKDLSWSPSNGGKTGDNYRYVPDEEGEGNEGFSRFVAFEGSKTAALANGGFVDADGNWETTLRAPQQVFETVDREGKAAEVDCSKVVCGVITFGAHNINNPNNETFTPVTFVEDTTIAPNSEPSDEAPSADPAASQSPSADQDAGVSQQPSTQASDTVATVEDQDTKDNEGTNLLVVGGITASVIVVAAGVVVAVKRSKK